MSLVVVGLNHRSAPVELREAFAVPPDALAPFLHRVQADPEVAEAMLVSTCNRVELYVVPSGAPDRALARAEAALTTSRGLDAARPGEHAYRLQGSEAIRHLLRVTASLDSMVVGEPQILGQVKEAAKVADAAGTLGPVLGRLLQRAFRAAKSVRTQTGIARSRVSVGSVAVDLARRIFDDLSHCRVLLVGAGKMGEIMGRSLAGAGVSRVYIANRSYERALGLAERHGWRARAFTELEELLAEVDVVLTSTGASRPIIDVPTVKRVVRARKYRPIFFVDIAVPRDIDPAVGALDTVYLYNVDDLQALGQENRKARELEAQAAEALVASELADIERWLEQLAVQPTIAAIRQRAEELARGELERSLAKRLKHLPEADRAALDKMLQAAVAKILHPTMTALRDAGKAGPASQLVASARVLFGMDVPEGADGADATAPTDDPQGRPALVVLPGSDEARGEAAAAGASAPRASDGTQGP